MTDDEKKVIEEMMSKFKFRSDISEEQAEYHDARVFEAELIQQSFMSEEGRHKNHKYRAMSPEDQKKFRHEERMKKEIQELKKGLAEVAGKSNANLVDRGLIFIRDEGLLEIHGKKITISKTSYKHEILLLNTIFKDINRVWDRGDILEDWGYTFDEIKSAAKSIIYTPSKSINQKVALQGNIPDFLIFGTTYSKINPKYL